MKTARLVGQLDGEGSYASVARAIIQNMPALQINERTHDNTLHICPPNYYKPDGAKNLAQAVFEGSQAPPDWIGALKSIEVPFTFSEHNIDAFYTDMEVLVPPVDLKVFTPGSEKEADAEKVFLFVGQSDERKNAVALLQAWEALELENAKLIMHMYTVTHGEKAPNIRPVSKMPNMPANVELTGKLLPLQGLIQLYQNADYFVLPSRAEGHQHISLEAMACGCNAIITDEPSAKCLKRRNGVFFVPSSVIEPDISWCNRNIGPHYTFDWHNVSVESLASTIENAYKHPVSRSKCVKTATAFDAKICAEKLWGFME